MEDQNGVKHKVSPQTRFILEDENRSKEYFDYFCDLAPTLNERFIAAERKGEALWLKRALKRMWPRSLSFYPSVLSSVCFTPGLQKMRPCRFLLRLWSWFPAEVICFLETGAAALYESQKEDLL